MFQQNKLEGDQASISNSAKKADIASQWEHDEKSATTITARTAVTAATAATALPKRPSTKPFEISQCVYYGDDHRADAIVAGLERLPPSRANAAPEPIPIQRLSDLFPLPIDDDLLEQLCFAETLFVSAVDRQPKPISPPRTFLQRSQLAQVQKTGPKPLIETDRTLELGGININVEFDANNFTIYASAQFSCERGLAQNNLMAIVTKQLEVVEDKKTESICPDDDSKLVKSMHVFKRGGELIANRKTTDSAAGTVHIYQTAIRSCPVTDGDLILDGQSVLLMRYMAITRFVGCVHTQSLQIDGEMCTAIYEGCRPKKYTVNGCVCDILRIVRTVVQSNGTVAETSRSYFSVDGRLVKHTWTKCDYILHVNPTMMAGTLDQHTCWLMHPSAVAEYLDGKQRQPLDKRFDIKSIVKDYVVCLKQFRPANVLDFTIDYFVNIGADVNK